MRFLLDENFPLALLRRLRESGYDAEHLITLGQRGLPDSAIRQRLEREADLVLMTQDGDFEDLAFPCLGIVIVSHVRQGLGISERVAVCGCEPWLRSRNNRRTCGSSICWNRELSCPCRLHGPSDRRTIRDRKTTDAQT